MKSFFPHLLLSTAWAQRKPVSTAFEIFSEILRIPSRALFSEKEVLYSSFIGYELAFGSEQI